jgi:hypothetical protein
VLMVLQHFDVMGSGPGLFHVGLLLPAVLKHWDVTGSVLHCLIKSVSSYREIHP